MFEYMLQSRESSWGFPSTLQTVLNLLLVNVKRSSAEQIKKRKKVFSVRQYKESIENLLASPYGKTFDLLPPMGKHDDFIKISYCIFRIHKPSIKFCFEK